MEKCNKFNINLRYFLWTLLGIICIIGTTEALSYGTQNQIFSPLGNFTNSSAGYFIGNGTFLTDVCLSNGVSCPAGFVDTQKKAGGIYLYNDSTTIYYNETRLNSTIDIRTSGLGGNSSWNESLAHTLFDSTYNSTYDAYKTNVSINYTFQTYNAYNTVWSSTYNATYASNQANNSFNQTLTNLLYSSISWNYNQTLAAYNLYNTIWSTTFNATYDSGILSWNGNSTALLGCINNQSYLSTYNATYASNTGNSSWNESLAHTLFDSTYNSTYNTYIISNYTNKSNYWDNMNIINTTQMQDNAGVLNILENWLTTFGNTLWCKVTGGCTITGNLNVTGNINATLYYGNGSQLTGITAIETEPAWNGNYTTYSGLINNQSYLSTYNSTYESYKTNVSINYTLQTYNAYNTVWSSTYNATYASNTGNSSWNESLAHTLFDSTYNSTYDSKTSFPGYANIALTNQSNTFIGNQNLSNNNITSVDCIWFKNNASWCSL
jgi:hypothetical protein